MKACRFEWTRWFWLLLAAWLMTTAAQAGSTTVHAFLDRDHARLGDTVTLNIEIDGAIQSVAPDVSALRSDFDILGTSHNTSVSIINGQSSIKTLWAISLRPNHTGSLTIPSLTVNGQQTAPLTLTVGAAPATAKGEPGGPVFIKVKPSTLTPYVGQPINLDVRLYYASTVSSGSLDVPHGKDVDVRPLGKSTRYQVQRGGHFYQVLEKHYAVTAQHPGPLNLSPIVFKGTMVTSGGFAGFFGNGRTVTARSAPIHLAVRARPAASGKGAWLPARKVTLTLSGLPADGQVKVGQTVTLTLTEKAVGLPFESLPKPQLPKLDGVDVYPDQSQDHTGNDGHWLVGTRTRKFALVPQKAGALTIPAITLGWWNVKTHHKAVARIPAHTLTVVAAADSGNQATAAPAPAASAELPAPVLAAPVKTVTPGSTKQAPSASSHWLAWAALALWLLTALLVVGFWWWRRRHRSAPVSSDKPASIQPATWRQAHRAFLEATRHGGVAAQCDSLLAWARTERSSLRHLSDLSAALDSPQQREAIAQLQRARYAGVGEGPDTETLETTFRDGLAWRAQTKPGAVDTALPPLYPDQSS